MLFQHTHKKKKSGTSFLKTLLFYCSFCIVFVIGLLIGLWQCSISCNGITEKNLVPNNQASFDFQKQSIFFIVVIFSAPSNHEQRQTIRKTWLLTGTHLHIQHFFAVGTSNLNSQLTSDLLKEHNENGDLLLLDSVEDSFSKLSIKLLAIFCWLDKYIDFTYLLKVDDDSFVRLDALHLELTKHPKTRLYLGFFDGQARVKIKGKWKEQNWFLCDRYLPYAKGGGYVLTSDLIHNVVQVSNYVSLYQNEDVTLGAWLAPFDIKRVHEPRFDTEYMSRGCNNSYLITHKQSSTMMITKYNNLKESGKLCLAEYRDRNSYNYNWQMPPSLCCTRNETKIP